MELVKALVSEGAISKASKHLISRGIAKVDDPGVREALAALHPEHMPVSVSDDLPKVIPADLLQGTDLTWESLSWDAAQSFPAGSAPGPSGFRPGHLKELLAKAGRHSRLSMALGGMCQLACEGHLPRSAAEFLCAATLIPLQKEGWQNSANCSGGNITAAPCR